MVRRHEAGDRYTVVWTALSFKWRIVDFDYKLYTCTECYAVVFDFLTGNLNVRHWQRIQQCLKAVALV